MDPIRYVVDLQGAQGGSRFRGIGRYSLNLALAMAEVAGQHEMWIALNGLLADAVDPLRAKFEGLVPQDRIVTFELPGPVMGWIPANAWRRSAAERLREYFLAGLSPDVVHVSSLFEGWEEEIVTSIEADNSSFSTVVTCYDLIPLLYPQQHLSTPEVKAYYLRKAQSLKRADMVFAISESSRRETIEALTIPEDRVINISTGFDNQFRVIALSPDQISALLESLKIKRPFIMYTGQIEARKNVEGLIQAFAVLPAMVRERHQLVIAGKHHQILRERLQEFIVRAGLRPDEVIFPGYVNDNDLVALYNLCSLFVLPSFHEGFGLPALEAMACGAPTIASNRTSLPEVIGWDDAMFDPHQPAELAEKMKEALTEESFRETLRQRGLQQCKKFTWDRSARTAWGALEELRRQRQSGRKYMPVALASRERARMAYFSPLPPEKSGIADYSAELLPELARYYDIDVVVDQKEISDPWITANFPVLTVSSFSKHASKYNRVLYHMGNSVFHAYMFDVIRRFPSVVVLHDFYLSGVLNWMQASGRMPDDFSRIVFDSHGYLGVRQEKEFGRGWAVRNLPCNRRVIESAAGVIVHSKFSLSLADKWYGPGTSANWRLIPFLRGPKQKDRNGARVRLGIPKEDYLVCSFGIVDPTKLNHRLLSAWLGSRLASDQRCHLVFVGEPTDGEYARPLLHSSAVGGVRERIRVTGFVPIGTYRDYLSAADCAVQLRAESRGETSAAVYDCLTYGLPLIINSNGALAEVPEHVALKLPDVFNDAELSKALDLIYSDPEYRRAMSGSASELMSEHHPARVGELYREAIESFAMSDPLAKEQRLLVDLASMPSPVAPAFRDLVETSNSIALQRRSGNRQLLLDVSGTAYYDLGTGIQRLARNIPRELIQNPGEFRIEPVRFVGGQAVYARNFTLRVVNVQMELEESKVEFRPEDIYIALDWYSPVVHEGREFFTHLRAHNVPIYFVIFDLLPIVQPDKFPDWSLPEFRRWLSILCEFSDGLACISRSVADELLLWLDRVQPPRWRPLKIGYFHLGADINEGASEHNVTPGSVKLPPALRERPSVLMVGTIEPRKAHSQALDAFEQLWAENVQANLVIVGRPGWHVESLLERISKHKENGNRLFLLPDVSDETLSQVYSSATVLLAASMGEGFGLPLIESAQKRLPIIARDIPVFREVAGEHAFYFRGNSAESLATALRAWLDVHSSGGAPSSEGLKWLTWKESAQQLMEVVLGRRPYREWVPACTSIQQFESESVNR